MNYSIQPPSNPRLPTRDSATGKSIATTLQTLLAFLAVVFANQDLLTSVTEFYPWLIPVLPIAAGLVTFLNNLFRSNVNNY